MSIRASLPCLVAVAAFAAFASACGTKDGGNAGGGGGGTLYYSNGSGSGEIWAFSMASGEQQRLFLGTDPDRTPEGTFIYQRASLFESADGVAPRKVVDISGGAAFQRGFIAPRLSPDGTRIAYTSDGGEVVYVVNRADGSLVSSFPARVASVAFERPSWTPDGRLVVSSVYFNPGLFISDAALTTWTRFDPNLGGPREPTVSPDGTLVAFILNRHIFTIHLDGTGVKQITDGDLEEETPVFSPDGASIAAYQRPPRTLIVVPTGGGPVTDLGAANPELKANLSSCKFCWR
ncbi:MAG: hypothetical protein NVS3B10_24610 [Polyangiales bacterium]